VCDCFNIIICGDFRQILPIIPRGRRADIVKASLKRSSLWKHCTTLKLTENMRVQRMIDKNPTQTNIEYLQQYSEWLLSIGEGTTPTVRDNIIELDREIVCETVNEVIDEIYNDFESNSSNPEYFKDRAILASTNAIVDTINEQMLDKLQSPTQTFPSLDTVMDPDHAPVFPTEFLNKIEYSGMPQHN